MFESYYKHRSYLLPYCPKYLKYIYHQTTTGYVFLWLSFRMTILFSFNALYFPLCHLICLGCTEICCLTVMPEFLVPVTCVFYSDFQVLLISRFSELFNHLNLISNLHKWLLYLYIYMFGMHVYICLFMCAWNTYVYVHVKIEFYMFIILNHSSLYLIETGSIFEQSLVTLYYCDRVFLWTYNLSFWLFSQFTVLIHPMCSK